jgi:phospholipid/cholesterol/gamma-HCH transport system permease protein
MSSASASARNNKEAKDRQQEPKPFISKSVESFFLQIGGMAIFTRKFFAQVFRRPFEFAEIVKQGYAIGVNSLGLVGVTGFIMGLVLTIQSRPTLVEFGAESMLPGMVSISIVREIAPVITALICAGKIASRIGAELGSMKVTEQIDAMEVSGTNPFKYIVVTRILACLVTIPILIFYADAVGLIGSFLGANIKGHISFKLFFMHVFRSVEFSDLFPATIKTLFFGFAIGLVGCYKGYNAENGTEGVGTAANSAVVVASLLVFIIDMIAVQITDLIY